MTPKELNDGVRFIVDKDNHTTAVVVPPDLWHSIIRALEERSEHEFEALLKEQVPASVTVASLLMHSTGEDLA